MRYPDDILSGGSAYHRAKPVSRDLAATAGLVVEEVTTGWVGAVTRVEKSGGLHVVVLEDRRGRTRTFPLGPGFWVEGQPVRLVPPVRSAPQRPARTASGSRAVTGARARIARPSRIFVEGKHDAELVEKIWGDDLRVEGVVVELLEGVDHLAEVLADYSPTLAARAGVLVDHLVPGSKEQHIVADVARRHDPRTVLIVGHPYVDVWQSVRPQRLGLDSWPTIPRAVEWKRGVLAHLGWPDQTQADIARGWARILGTVTTYSHLEPALLGRVEELIDFVTATPPGDRS